MRAYLGPTPSLGATLVARSQKMRNMSVKPIALFKPDDLPDHFDRQAVVNAAVKLYGKRADG